MQYFKTILTAFVAATLMTSCTSRSKSAESPKSNCGVSTYYCRSTTSCPFSEITLQGVGTNVTANISTGVTMNITCKDGSLQTKGAYDSQNLFGKFDIEGKILPTCYGRGSVCMQFAGDLFLGWEGSPFNRGLKKDYLMSIALTASGAQGVYTIAPSADIDKHPQHGYLQLFKLKSPVRGEHVEWEFE